MGRATSTARATGMLCQRRALPGACDRPAISSAPPQAALASTSWQPGGGGSAAQPGGRKMTFNAVEVNASRYVVDVDTPKAQQASERAPLLKDGKK